jgi:hypothetical protein
MSVPAPPAPKGGKHFTPFYSAAEEAVTKAEEETSKDGGHMSSTCGRIVRTPGADLPYKVVLTHHGRAESTQSFATMREAEAFIRRNTPVPAPRSTLRDQDATEAPPIHAPNDGIAE